MFDSRSCVIDVDENEVPLFAGRRTEHRIDVTVADPEARVCEQLGRERDQAVPQEADDLGEKLDHLDPSRPGRFQHLVGCVAEAQAAHEYG